MRHEKRATKPAAQAGPPMQSAEIVDAPRQWGLLPNGVALDPTIEEIALVMAAYRLTYAGSFVLTVRDVAGIARRGAGERPYWRGLRVLQAAGLLVRRTAPSGRQGPAQVVDDALTLPEETGRYYRRVERRWFDGTLSVKALALLLFVRASGDERASAWHIVKRFGWSDPTARSAAEELIEAGLVERRGEPRKPIYAQANSKKRQSKKEQSKNGQSKKRQVLHTVDPSHTVSPLHTVCPAQSEAGEERGLGTDWGPPPATNSVEGIIGATADCAAIDGGGVTGFRRQTMMFDSMAPTTVAEVGWTEKDRNALRRLGVDLDDLLDRAHDADCKLKAQRKPGVGNWRRYMMEIAREDHRAATNASRAATEAIATGNKFQRQAALKEIGTQQVKALLGEGKTPEAQDGKTPNRAALLRALSQGARQ